MGSAVSWLGRFLFRWGNTGRRSAAIGGLCTVFFPGLSTAVPLPQADCVIHPFQEVDLSSAVPGVLDRVMVERSDLVNAGQEVAVLKSGVERANLRLARARARIDAGIRLEETGLAFDQRRLERVNAVHTNLAVSPQDLDRAERDVATSLIRLEQARQQKTLWELELVRAKELLKQKTVISPIDGVVVERFKAGGEYVEDQPIIRVAQLDPLHVEAIVPMELFGRIQSGMSAEIYPENVQSSMHQATVSVVDKVGDPASGTFGVRLVLPNPDLKLPAGLKCHLRWLEGEQSVSSDASAPAKPAADYPLS